LPSARARPAGRPGRCRSAAWSSSPRYSSSRVKSLIKPVVAGRTLDPGVVRATPPGRVDPSAGPGPPWKRTAAETANTAAGIPATVFTCCGQPPLPGDRRCSARGRARQLALLGLAGQHAVALLLELDHVLRQLLQEGAEALAGLLAAGGEVGALEHLPLLEHRLHDLFQVLAQVVDAVLG